MDGQSLMNSKISNRGFQGWTAETALMVGIGRFKGIVTGLLEILR